MSTSTLVPIKILGIPVTYFSIFSCHVTFCSLMLWDQTYNSITLLSCSLILLDFILCFFFSQDLPLGLGWIAFLNLQIHVHRTRRLLSCIIFVRYKLVLISLGFVMINLTGHIGFETSLGTYGEVIMCKWKFS